MLITGGEGSEVVDVERAHRGGDCAEDVPDVWEARHDEHKNGESRT